MKSQSSNSKILRNLDDGISNVEEGNLLTLLFMGQHSAKDFSRHRFGKALPKLDMLWYFEGSQSMPAVLTDLIGCGLLPGPENNPGLDRLSLIRVGRATHAYLKDGRMG